MITDRTAADVDTAKEVLERVKYISPFPALTDEEKAILERGTYTKNSLNRVESKQKELAEILNCYRYMVQIENKTDWTETDVFTHQDYMRYLKNLDKLKQAFFIYQSTPTTPTYLFNYTNANDVEKILADIESMIDDMTDRFRECGTFQCGEANAL